MKIVLNKEELQSMKVFMGSYMRIVADNYSLFDQEEGERLSSMTNDELVSEIMNGAFEGFIVTEVDDIGNYHIDINSDVFVLYTNSMSESVDYIKSYTDTVAGTIAKHQSSLTELPYKIGAIRTLVNKPMVMRAVNFVSNLLGIKGLVYDLLDVYQVARNDEELKENLKSTQDRLLTGLDLLEDCKRVG